MGLYIGISCLHSNWHGLSVSVDSGEVNHGEAGGLPKILDKFSGFADVEAIARLNGRGISDKSVGESCPESDSQIDRVNQAFNRLEDDGVGEYFMELKRGLSSKIAGIVHPYTLSQISRYALIAFFYEDPISNFVRAERNSLPANAREGKPAFCALEAPLAVVLQQIVSGVISTGATVAVVSPGVDEWELTTVSLSFIDGTLNGSVKAFGTCSFAAAPNDVDVLLAAAGVSVDDVLLVGNVSEAVVKVQDTIAGCSVRAVAEVNAAIGAAIYAALCGGEAVRCSEGAITDVEFQLLAPYPIGICQIAAAEQDPSVVWCPIIEAGDSLTETLKPVRADEATDVFLAECLSKSRAPGEWVTETSDLRWHSHIQMPAGSNNKGKTLKVAVSSSAGCLNYGWSDQFARISIS
ncbi:MAG: hypothetical protein ABGZ35_25600 [Planctomycetaceae bacterium]